MRNSTVIIIPAYNEGRHMEQILRSIKAYSDLPVCVVDDGSADNTGLIAEQYADTVIRHSVNMGKGRSLMDGLRKMSSRYQYAVLMDADGQHRPEDIEYFTDKSNYSHDIIIGNRDMALHNMPIERYLTNKITTLVTSLLAGRNTFDSQSGFRMVNIQKILHVPIKTFRFQMESEMLINAGRMGYSISSVTVKTIYGDEISKINPVIDTLRFIKMALETLWR